MIWVSSSHGSCYDLVPFLSSQKNVGPSSPAAGGSVSHSLRQRGVADTILHLCLLIVPHSSFLLWNLIFMVTSHPVVLFSPLTSCPASQRLGFADTSIVFFPCWDENKVQDLLYQNAQCQRCQKRKKGAQGPWMKSVFCRERCTDTQTPTGTAQHGLSPSRTLVFPPVSAGTGKWESLRVSLQRSSGLAWLQISRKAGGKGKPNICIRKCGSLEMRGLLPGRSVLESQWGKFGQ